MSDYINPSREPFDNWFYFINHNYGIFNTLNKLEVYIPLVKTYAEMKSSSNEDKYIELLKLIGTALYGKGNLIYEYASALMSVNFLKQIYPTDPETIGEILFKIATQRSEIEIVESKYEGEVVPEKTIHIKIGIEHSGKYLYKLSGIEVLDNRAIKYSFRKSLNTNGYFIKYYMFWRDYKDMFKDYIKNNPSEPHTVASKKFNNELLKFRFPTEDETYHHFEHIII